MNSESRMAVMFRGLLVCAAFFTLGLCVSIIGPTLPDLMSRTNTSSLSAGVSVVSANSFGCLLGIAFGGSCYNYLNAFCVMAVMLVVCAGLTLVTPWCTTLTGVTIICLLQGLTLGFLERGGYSMFYAYWKRKHHVLQLFYFAMALGACISPLVTTPFVFSRFLNSSSPIPSPSSGSNVAYSSHGLRAERAVAADNETALFDTLLPNNSTPVTARTEEVKKPNSAKNYEREEFFKEEIKPGSPTSTVETLNSTTSPTTGTVAGSATSSTTSTSSSTTTTTATSTTTTTTTSTIPKSSTKRIITSSSTVSSVGMTTATTYQSLPEKSTSQSSGGGNSTGPTVLGQTRKLVWRELQRLVLSRVSEINRVHFAYLVVATLSMVSTLGFGLMCCCMPCRSLRLPADNKWDYRFTPGSLCASRPNLYCLFCTILFAFLEVGMESVIYNLMTMYLILDHGQDQAKGVLLTTVYWLMVATSRLTAATFKRAVNPRLTVLFCLVGTIFIAATMAVFSDNLVVIWLAVGCLGLTVGPVFPLAYSYLDHSLGFSPWVSSIWLSAAQLGRLTLPSITASVIDSRNSPKYTLFGILVAALLCGVVFIFLQRAAKTASQLLAVDAFTRQIRQANGDVAEYRRMSADFDDISGMEMEKLEEDLFGADTVHFERSEAADDIFARYTNSASET